MSTVFGVYQVSQHVNCVINSKIVDGITGKRSTYPKQTLVLDFTDKKILE